MKNSVKIFAILSIAALALASCKKDGLTLYPEHQVTPEKYFKTESDLLLWSNQFYKNMLPSAEIGATTDFHLSNGISGYVNGTRNPATQSWSYTDLRKINYMLDNLNQCEDKAVALKYEAVGRFFRAYFYMQKVMSYGDVPYYQHVLGSDDPDVFKARDDRGAVMDSVIVDFKFAAENLPSSWEALNTRVTKWAAMAMGSRAALFEGTFRKYHNMKDADKYLKACVDFGSDFIKNSPFSIYKAGTTPYRDLFVADNALTTEVILARHYDTAFGIFHSMGYQIGFGRHSFTRRFMNHYLMKDGKRFTEQDGWETMDYMTETKNRDPRMEQTVMCPGYVQKGATAVTPCTFGSWTGYEPIKFMPVAAKCPSSSDDTDYPIIRTAEVYLNYAEALAELGTIKQSDIDATVNKIRARVGMPALDMAAANASPCSYMAKCYPHVPEGANKGVILEIRRERSVELVMEEPDRQWDLFRWHEADQALQCKVPWYGVYVPAVGQYDTSGDGKADVEFKKNAAGAMVIVDLAKKTETEVTLSDGDKGYIVAYSSTNYGTGWDDARDYLWPIPASQRELNKNLTQNPGYVDGIN